MLSAMTPLGPRGPRGSATDLMGYESDYPVAGKVAGKPRYLRPWGGFPGSSRTPGTPLASSGISRSRPYSWPPDLTERAGP